MQTVAFNKSRPAAGFLSTRLPFLNIVSLFFVLAFVVLYIVQANGSVSSGYEIRELETTIEKLSLDNQRLEVETRKTQSLDHVARSVKMLGLIPAEAPTYVDGQTPSYAFAGE